MLFGFISTVEKEFIPLTLERFSISTLLNLRSFLKALPLRSSLKIILNLLSNLTGSNVLKTQTPFIVHNISFMLFFFMRQNIYAFFQQASSQNYMENTIFNIKSRHLRSTKMISSLSKTGKESVTKFDFY
jgi:hypothetical protein